MVGTHKHLVSHVQHDLVSVLCFFTWYEDVVAHVCVLLYKTQPNCDYASVLTSYTGLQSAAISNFKKMLITTPVCLIDRAAVAMEIFTFPMNFRVLAAAVGCYFAVFM